MKTHKIWIVRKSQHVLAKVSYSKASGERIGVWKYNNGDFAMGVVSDAEFKIGKKITEKQIAEQMKAMLTLSQIFHRHMLAMARENKCFNQDDFEEWDISFNDLAPEKKEILVALVKPMVPIYLQRKKLRYAFQYGLVGQMVRTLENIQDDGIVDETEIGSILFQVKQIRENMSQASLFNDHIYGLTQENLAKGKKHGQP